MKPLAASKDVYEDLLLHLRRVRDLELDFGRKDWTPAFRKEFLAYRERVFAHAKHYTATLREEQKRIRAEQRRLKQAAASAREAYLAASSRIYELERLTVKG